MVFKTNKKIVNAKTAKSVLKKAKRAAEAAVIHAVNRRDRVCQLCRSINVLQVDHCFSRTVSALFFDLKNLTLLCRSCHLKKTFHSQGFEKRVDDFVRLREGEEWWIMAKDIALSKSVYKHTIFELINIKKHADRMFV